MLHVGIEEPYRVSLFSTADGIAQVSLGYRETERGVGISCRGGAVKGGKSRRGVFIVVHLAWA